MQSGSTTGYCDLTSLLIWLRHVLAIFFYGGLGGLTYAAASLLDGGKNAPGSAPQAPKEWAPLKGSPMQGYISGQVLIGIGGAMAAILGILTIGKAVGSSTGDEYSLLYERHLYLYSLCFVAGFISNKLLPAIGRNVQEQFEKFDKKQQQTDAAVERVKDRQQETEAKLKENREFSKLTVDVTTARDEATRLEKLNNENRKKPENERVTIDMLQAEKYIMDLEAYRKKFPTNRYLHIVLANLYLETGKREKGAEVLRQFIKNREEAKETNDDDVATAWFNLACFACLGAREKEGEENEKKLFLENAADYLRKCLTTARNAGKEVFAIQRSRATSDTDLGPLDEGGLRAEVLNEFP